jgi:hypothetical protein
LGFAVSLPIQKSIAKIMPLSMQKLAAKNCDAAHSEIDSQTM